MEEDMRAIPGAARHFGWASLPAPRRRAATRAGTALEQAVRPMLEELAAAAGRAASAVWRWRLINRNIKTLSQLDDRLLADIGLHRSEIVASVHRRVGEIERLGRYPYW
jgi:uncharacterized protein YjiS (DUF1127 family)